MACVDISSQFITKALLDKLYGELDIPADASPIFIDPGHRLDCKFQSANQITTMQKIDDHLSISVYASAQNYFQSEKDIAFGRPDMAKKAAVSKTPLEDGYVPEEDYRENEHNWTVDRQIDAAFKCNWLKFIQNEDLAYELLVTGNQPIVSTRKSPWGERSQKILMVIREYLWQQSDAQEAERQKRKSEEENENESCSKVPKCLGIQRVG